MTVTLRLEAIGERGHEDGFALLSAAEQLMGLPASRPFSRKPWVAEITGTDDHRDLARRFLDGRKDYSQANGAGTRGVYVYYHLREGRIYEVSHWVSWRSKDHYFCVVHDDILTRLGRDEVEDVFT